MDDRTGFKRRLNTFDASMIVSGAIIGAGIFMNPSESAKFCQSSSQLLFVWALGGFIAFFGAFCFAELGAMFPMSGGQYVYLQEAFSPWVGFLFGWTLFSTIQTGALAAVAYTCARFIGFFYPMADFTISLVAAAIIWFLTVVNFLGIRPGSIVQNVFTVLKILSLMVLVGWSLFFFKAPAIDWGPLFPSGLTPQSFSLLGLALIPVLFSYGGWQNVNFVAGEVKNPERSLPRAIISGVSLVVIIYVLTNASYIKALSLEDISRSTKLASDAMAGMVGPLGTGFVSAAIIISTFGFTNVAIMTGPRVYFAMAKNGAFFHQAAKLHPRFKTPTYSILFQSLWATALLFSNTYGQLLQYVTFGDWIFFGLTALALLVLRKRRPDILRPYRTWGYPVVPLLFFVIAEAVVINVFVSSFLKSLVGSLIILGGLPLFVLSKKLKEKSHAI